MSILSDFIALSLVVLYFLFWFFCVTSCSFRSEAIWGGGEIIYSHTTVAVITVCLAFRLHIGEKCSLQQTPIKVFSYVLVYLKIFKLSGVRNT